MATLSSTIGRSTVVRGSVRGDGDLVVEGRVEGSVAVGGDLTLGESALVKSDVSGRRVVVRGAVLGNVSAEESLVLERGARVVGDLASPQIGIRPGALLRGNVSTEGNGAPARPARAAAARAPERARPPARAAAPAEKTEAARPRAGSAKAAPAPVMPALRKGAKASLKRKGGR
jgi:cytoskeletal protein CcmA (bactofilin family)